MRKSFFLETLNIWNLCLFLSFFGGGILLNMHMFTNTCKHTHTSIQKKKKKKKKKMRVQTECMQTHTQTL